MAEKKQPLTYKGRPITRSGNEVFYGNPTDPYIVFIQILSTEEKDGVEVASKVHVQLLNNDASLSAKNRIVKQSDKVGLYSALDIGHVWLERAGAGDSK